MAKDTNYTPQDIADTLIDTWGFAHEHQEENLGPLFDFASIPATKNAQFPIVMASGQVFLVEVTELRALRGDPDHLATFIDTIGAIIRSAPQKESRFDPPDEGQEGT